MKFKEKTRESLLIFTFKYDIMHFTCRPDGSTRYGRNREAI